MSNFMKSPPPHGSRDVSCDGRTDRHDEARSRFPQILRTRLKNDFPQEVSGVMLRQRIQTLDDDLDPRIAQLFQLREP